MEKLKKHTRYREFSIGYNDGNCSNHAKKLLKVVLFKSDIKFRSHAVKHLANPKEFEKIFKKLKCIDKELVLRSIAKLQDIECPYHSIKQYRPSCKNCKKNEIKKFNSCTDFISEFENQYFNLACQLIGEGSVIPRYANFLTNIKRYRKFVLIPDTPIVIVASFLNDDTYNLVTCYSDTGRNFIELRDSQVDRVRKEAGNNIIEWYDKNTWGIGKGKGNRIGTFTLEESISQNSRPFKRGDSRSWRQALNEIKDK